MTDRGLSLSADVDRLTRRSVIVVGITVGLAGCIGLPADAVDLDPADFDDEYLYLVASGVSRTDLVLVEITRAADNWTEVTVETELELDSHYPDWFEGMPTPDGSRELLREFLTPPTPEPIIDGYIEAVQAGETSEGLRVFYDDGRCTGGFVVPRNRVEWYLNDTLELGFVYAESRFTYSVDCP